MAPTFQERAGYEAKKDHEDSRPLQRQQGVAIDHLQCTCNQMLGTVATQWAAKKGMEEASDF
jgi:hypothetical protein